jgi:hypothetical protein
MYELLGTFPRKMKMSGKYAHEFFNKRCVVPAAAFFVARAQKLT